MSYALLAFFRFVWLGKAPLYSRQENLTPYLTSEEAAETYAFIDTTLSCVSITLLYYYYHRFVANCGNSETGAVRENTYDRLEGENG